MNYRLINCTFLALLFCLFSTPNVHGQTEFQIRGKVIDASNGEELIGVNIFSEGQKLKGTVTDINGEYSLSVIDNSEVVFRFIGYQDYRVTITSNQTLDVELETSEYDLNPVIISASRRKEKILDAPSAITLITAESIENKVSLSINDHIKDASGVHVMKTGIQGGPPSVRGFNGYYSANVMTLVDNRIARLPNFRINAYNMIPTSEDDLARIEVLKGPASALYGPNTSNGVVHMITKSPIDNQETRFALGFGARSYIKGPIKISDTDNPRFDDKALMDRLIGTISFRHSDTISTPRSKNLKVGYKISTKYFRGNDWKYNDLNDPEQVIRYIPGANGITPLKSNGRPLTEEEIANGEKGDLVNNERDETINKGSIDGRLDFRFKPGAELIFSGGFNYLDGIDINPVGAVQQRGWTYSYIQSRLLYKDFFIQAYANFSNSGDTYFVPLGALSIDRSKFYATQIQHSWEPSEKLKLIYGADAFFTRPDTRNTLNGRYENEDNINEFGAYLQADYELLPKISILMAGRIDYHSEIKNPFASPRAAIVYKPASGQNLRFTFNRAFKTPGAATFFIDVRQAEIPTGIGVRALGTQDEGFQYSYAENPYFENQLLPQFRSPFSNDPNAYYNVGDPVLNDAGWNGILDVIKSEFLNQFGFESNAVIDQIIDVLIGSLVPSEIGDINHVVRDLNSTTRTFVESDWENIQDITKLRNTISYNYEIGYKGILLDFLSVSFDAYKTDYKNYLAPVTFVTPTVMLDADELINKLQPILIENLAKSENQIFNNLLVRLLDKNEDLGGDSDGVVDDELSDLIHEAISNLPIGTITPVQAGGPEMLLVSRNIGDISVYGFEAGIGAYVNKNLNLNAHYSFVDKDSILVPGAQFGYVALNAPKHKLVVGANYFIEKIGLNIGTKFNWQSGFPALSGNFVGHVPAFHDLDLDVSWRPTFHENLNVGLSIQNLYNNEHQFFVGSPEIGMMAMMRVGYTL